MENLTKKYRLFKACRDFSFIQVSNYRNLLYLLERKNPEQILVRVPLIPEYNTEADQEASRKKLLEMGVKNLDLFKYVRR